MSLLLSDPAGGVTAGAAGDSGAAGCGVEEFAGAEPLPAAVAGEAEAGDGGGLSAALFSELQPVSSIKAIAVIIQVFRPKLII
ncbi:MULTISPECIES: hypothetical protein [unclassified Paenibacillus]|uniref:hypothetical protein n=1 Tax=unclassified Paenibacillus TaxID=185978 RepID=UPI0024067B76|nr:MULTISPECIES: hypothetical protein [unclassified Paenibacillus]MDF9839171.1 hypothetical protein [Paenibacillus sp. PastF-2]MDF9845753.1 hypothetical protein [Paenibacillus sp. PastM-2]MDF9852325.1 hypothetical protein [Paenibacillus sp. PastF-1]MDH6477945.1 hypothetical protein [Paenibacillus sp. PastH-2]